MDDPKALSLHGPSSVNGAASARVSFESFFELERDHLFGLLALMTGDRSEAEEIAQDAFVAVWERWDRVRLMDNPAGYLNRTAINAFRKRYRRSRLFGRVAEVLSSGADTTPADSTLMLNEALRSLTPRQRAALVLTELLGYSGEEAARALGVKASTIGALKHQGRAALRREVESSDD
jgi:RNA polymerase sigma factor (sigma-70 family)